MRPKKTILLVAMLGLPFLAMSDIMYWQVAESVTDKNSGVSIDWRYARIRATTADTTEEAIYGDSGGMEIQESMTTSTDDNKILSNVNSANQTKTLLSKTDFSSGSAVYANLPEGNQWSGYNFYVELYDSKGTLVGFSDSVSYSAVSGYIAGSVQQAAQMGLVNSYNWTNFTAVPEPTSGVMLLLGAALLGLRRRRLA